MLEYLLALTLSFLFIQQFFFMRQIQKLVDKVMSRSYTEYVKSSVSAPVPQQIKISEDVPEDLRTLQEFQL